MVTARSIIFSDHEINTTLNNSKTMLRVPLDAKLTHDKQWLPDDWQRDPGGGDFFVWEGKQMVVLIESEERHRNLDYAKCSICCPYGKVGDRLWVKEDWAFVS